MTDRMLMAYGVAILLASFMSFIAWRVWYQTPEKVRLRRYRREHVRDLTALKEQPKHSRS